MDQRDEDHILLSRFKSGDDSAFEAIYYKYSDQLYAYGFRIIKDEASSIDVVQDLFTWLWEHREQLEITNLRSYLYAAVKYKLTRKIMTGRKRQEILAQLASIHCFPATDQSLELKDLQDVIRDFVDTLPPKAKEIFVLSREKHLPHKEIAEKLIISENTVRNHLNVTLKKLRLYLEKISYWMFFLFFFH
ncbi:MULTISPECIES: RNA polymerase sigma-70 factor [unclassified Sphingobacterium]|uniref:RNA polymerase sigma-70 factor n=1 Tax=unclassified Sphingobacterium TaxID=2609468 RepID=UPI0025E0BCFD|nr:MULTISPECIES: RNA polymerase sigma-70 factor [unclassified Sphingobacterium]